MAIKSLVVHQPATDKVTATDLVLAQQNVVTAVNQLLKNDRSTVAATSSLLPTAGEKAALAGTTGAPGTGNKYVTNADPRNSDARTPTAHNQAISTITGLQTALDGKEAVGSVAAHAALTQTHGVTSGAIASTSDARFPTSDEKAALVGTSGTAVSASNKLVDNADSRNTNARTPTLHDNTYHSTDYAADNAVVHLAGTETVTGAKSFDLGATFHQMPLIDRNDPNSGFMMKALGGSGGKEWWFVTVRSGAGAVGTPGSVCLWNQTDGRLVFQFNADGTVNGDFAVAMSQITGLATALSGKVDTNVAITPGTGTKLTVGANGLVTVIGTATASDVGAEASGAVATHAALTTGVHGLGGASQLNVGTTTGTVAAGNDSRFTNARAPTAHASTHNAGGSDALAIDSAAATGSLRTLGTAATAACAGNDARLSDSRTPAAHQLNGALHTVSGLTTGHFLKATGAATFGFTAHGLGYSDVGAAAASHTQAVSTISDSTTIGQNLVKLTDPGAISFPRFNVANTVDALSASDMRTALGLGTAATHATGDYAAAGAATASGLTMATARLLGRTTAAAGAIEEITVGSGLSLAAGALTCTALTNPMTHLGAFIVGGAAGAPTEFGGNTANNTSVLAQTGNGSAVTGQSWVALSQVGGANNIPQFDANGFLAVSSPYADYSSIAAFLAPNEVNSRYVQMHIGKALAADRVIKIGHYYETTAANSYGFLSADDFYQGFMFKSGGKFGFGVIPTAVGVACAGPISASNIVVNGGANTIPVTGANGILNLSNTGTTGDVNVFNSLIPGLVSGNMAYWNLGVGTATANGSLQLTLHYDTTGGIGTYGSLCIGGDAQGAGLVFKKGNIVGINSLTASLPVVTTAGKDLASGAWGTTAETFCQGNDSRVARVANALTASRPLASDASGVVTSLAAPVTTYLSADVALTNGSQYYTLLTTTVGVGKWLVSGAAPCNLASNGTFEQGFAKIAASGGSTEAVETMRMSAQKSTRSDEFIISPFVVTATASTTLTFSASSTSAGGSVFKFSYASGSILGTRLTVVQIA